MRIAPEEYCPAWPDDEEEDNPLPGWVEGDSLAPLRRLGPFDAGRGADLRLADSIRCGLRRGLRRR